MDNNKLETISNLFEGSEIRSVWDSEKEEYYFSVVDVIGALTESKDSKDYWYRLKKRMTEEERSELSTKCRQLKLKSKDGKFYSTDTLDTKGILRLIESVPSPKAEPFKLWLAQMGKERIDTNEVIQDNKNTESFENVIMEDRNIDTTNYLSIGMFSISAIFLIITIASSILLAKHQLNARKKSSK